MLLFGLGVEPAGGFVAWFLLGWLCIVLWCLFCNCGFDVAMI